MKNRKKKAVEYVVSRGYSKKAAEKILREYGIDVIIESKGFILAPYRATQKYS